MSKRNQHKVKRAEAAKLIEEVRVALADATIDGKSGKTLEETVARIRRAFADRDIPELVPCTGEAHSNAHIDNCSVCMPRWGFVGPEVTIS